jgi:hypothetical protein
MVLGIDLSGSMAWRDGTGVTCIEEPVPAVCLTGTNRLANARSAMLTLVDMLEGPNTRFGVTGWDQKVNASGALAGVAGANQMISPDIPYMGNADPIWSECGSNITTKCVNVIPPMIYLTRDMGRVRNGINALVPDGNTDGSLGFLWSLRQYENHLVGGWIGWEEPAQNRAIVFLTDGINTKSYNTPGLSDDAKRIEANNDQMYWCEFGKTQLGITIFTIAYNMPPNPTDPRMIDAMNVLRNCASQPDYFFNAANGAALAEIIETIGSSMMTMRLTK